MLNISRRRWSVHIPGLGIFLKIENILKKTYVRSNTQYIATKLNQYHVLHLALTPSCL